MSEPRLATRRGWPVPTVLAGIAVVVLAGLAAFWPRDDGLRSAGTFLVLDPAPGTRARHVYAPLAAYCGDAIGRRLDVTVVARAATFRALAAQATVMLCPDGVALSTPGAVGIAVGCRRAPQNLRPTSVLVSKKSAVLPPDPWGDPRLRTVFGDSLSLVCLAPLCVDGRLRSVPPGAAFGRDPYDHGAVLEALRLGAFDQAVVRQWAAEIFVAAAGDQADWQVTPLSEPLPDVVLLAGSPLSGQQRLTLSEAVVTLGRHGDAAPADELIAHAALAGLGLDGFNVLLEPDFAALRSRYGGCWLSSDE